MRQYRILALVLLGALSLGCVKEEMAGQAGHDGPVTLTTTVSLGEASGTKALTTEGIKTFAVGDQVAIVYTNTADATVKAVSEPLTADSILDGGKTAILTVTLTDPKPSGAVSYIYPAAMAAADGSVNYAALAVQQGSLAALAAGLDLCTFEGSLDTDASLPDCVILNNRLAVGEFTVKNEGGSDITDSIVCFFVSDGVDTYTVSRAASPGPIYVAMKPVSGDLRLVAADTNWEYYKKDVAAQTLAANKMYPIAVTMAQSSFESRLSPLTFEAIEAGATVSFRLSSNTAEGSVQYKLNDGSWTVYTSGTAITLTNAGDKVQFRGKNSTYYVNTASYDYGQFSVSAECYLYGNIMSLVTDYTMGEFAFASNVSLTGYRTFYRLFENVSNIKSLDTKPLVLPATSLAEGCYKDMFYRCTSLGTAPALPAMSLVNRCYDSMFDGCTSLGAAPALPATSLASNCYSYMFSGCTSLSVAPALPATILASGCYDGMFSYCTSLEVAPILPATSLAGSCYQSMFSGCTSLEVAPILPATSLAGSCYQSMFSGCTSLEVAPTLPATSLADYCYSYMFSGCTSLSVAPTLPATSLAGYCYYYMFSGCTSLEVAPVLPAMSLAGYCYSYMFSGCSKLSSITCLAENGITNQGSCSNWVRDVASTGTFTRTLGVNWPSGPNGIPSHWTVIFYDANQ